jgi:hypothetical protein
MATTKVITELTEFNPGNPDYVLNATNAVTVSAASGGNKYYFDGVYDGKFGLRIGTTVLTGVPAAHPFAVLNDGLTGITYTGTVNQGTKNVPDPGGPLYTFYSGDITITVTADFGVASYYCKIHGYMGGLNNFVSVYSEAGLRMPSSNAAYSGPTVAEGMMRNEVGQVSNGSASCMQHYNDTEWKNFVNIVQCTTTTCDYPASVGSTALYQMDSNSNDTCNNYTPLTEASITYNTSVKKYGTSSAQFNGSSSFISLPASININNNFTWSFWINFNTQAQYDTPIGFFMNSFTNYIDSVDVGKLSFFDGNSRLSTPSSTFATGTWYHVAITKSSSLVGGKGRIFYVNGSEVASDSVTTNSNSSTGGRNLFGAYSSDGNPTTEAFLFDGYLDQLRFYTTALSAANITLLANEVGC